MGQTWRTQIGMILCALSVAALMGELPGALTMLGTWMIWEDIKSHQTGKAETPVSASHLPQ